MKTANMFWRTYVIVKQSQSNQLFTSVNRAWFMGFNSLASGWCDSNFKSIIFKHIWQNSSFALPVKLFLGE